MRAYFVLFATTLLILLSIVTKSEAAGTLRLDIEGQRVEGSPISFSANHMYLLGRDGSLRFFNPHHAKNVRKISPGFRSYSASEMRGSLHREFGKSFEVSGTGHYLVVHPAGQRDVWAKRFEDLYRSFTHYFNSRGIRPKQPQFPLVAVVFHKREDFLRFASREGVNASNYLGYYSPSTNRIFLYDITAGKNKRNWHENAETIIHEATHQTANNTGIHGRFGSTPRWVAEGLATMFEARGVWNPRSFRQRADRINQGRLRSFRRHLSGQNAQRLMQLIADDRMFDSQQEIAYAEAWALTFFLAELEPHDYWRYLQKTSSRKPFEVYTSSQRQKDFTDIFGQDLTMLNARMVRFVQSL